MSPYLKAVGFAGTFHNCCLKVHQYNTWAIVLLLIFSSCFVLNSPCLRKPLDSKRSYGQARKCLSATCHCMSKICALWKPVLYCHIFIKEVSEWTCKANQNISTKSSSSKGVCVLWVHLRTWITAKRKHLLHDLVSVSSSGLWFAAVGNKTGLSLWNSDIPFLFCFPLLSFPDFTSPPDIGDTILQLQLGLRAVWAHTINFLKTNWAHCLTTKQLLLSNLQRTPMFSPKKMHTFRFWKYQVKKLTIP